MVEILCREYISAYIKIALGSSVLGFSIKFIIDIYNLGKLLNFFPLLNFFLDFPILFISGTYLIKLGIDDLRIMKKKL